MKVTIRLFDPIHDNGVRVEVEPKLNVLESAIGADKLTNAGVYALGALNYIRAIQEGKVEFSLPARRGRAFSLTTPVKDVTITLEDRNDGGVACHADPKFSTLAAMVAGGSELTEVHKYSMAALARVYEMGRGRA